jgi:hypothetical protein
MRELEVMKANWAATGQIVTMSWNAGVFKPDMFVTNPLKGETDKGPATKTLLEVQQDVEREFLRMLDQETTKKNNVSAQSTARNYAPTIFSRDSSCRYRGSKGRALLKSAMDRLFEKKMIRSAQYGYKSNDTWRIERAKLRVVE